MEEKFSMWPDHYPEKCPPKDAEDVLGLVYRFTNRANPKDRDFLSYYELKPDENWGQKACQARGLSVYTSEEDCKTAISLVPALKKKKLCIGELDSKSGVIAPTPSKNTYNHKTLWPLISAQDLAEIFIPIDFSKVAHA
ncbi:hypothetical protein RN346_15240 [Halomonas sp. PAMB 3232]|uniref:hypothetical protein n=1 Tax=Halomonas sp. PAMB 3232 TaxID=3075221 RepID=UPI0028A1B4FF|nr:hypothetical protein [Halomonas sp. PAMB 3232]WNL38631.1 hypothetical protein RN346_15240 [Halomonas sp. PAMB 3232]